LAAIYKDFFSLVIATGMMLALVALYLFQFGTACTGKIESSLLLIGAGLIALPHLILCGFGVKHVKLASSPKTIIFIPLIKVLVVVLILAEPTSIGKLMSMIGIRVAVTSYSYRGL